MWSRGVKDWYWRGGGWGGKVKCRCTIMGWRKGEPRRLHSHSVWATRSTAAYKPLGFRAMGMSSLFYETAAHTILSPSSLWISLKALPPPPMLAGTWCMWHMCTLLLLPQGIHIIFNIYVFLSFLLILTSSPHLLEYYPIYSDMHLSLHVLLRQLGLKLKLYLLFWHSWHYRGLTGLSTNLRQTENVRSLLWLFPTLKSSYELWIYNSTDAFHKCSVTGLAHSESTHLTPLTRLLN